ncbi:hypothetical protein ACP4OV_007361 [Aristida adscensionis]
MAEAAADRDAAGTDRISALPDELLQAILALLPCTTAAARTGVLSRRWRLVWARVPALSFQVDSSRAPGDPSSSTAGAVDAALAAYSADAALASLDLRVSSAPAGRLDRWLRFASRLLAGVLRLTSLAAHPVVPRRRTAGLAAANPHQLHLPACEKATRIELAGISVRLCLPQAGAFAALRVLRIRAAGLVDGDVGDLVSVRCPRLRELEMTDVGLAAGDLSIRSASLERLVLRRVTISRKKSQIQVALAPISSKKSAIEVAAPRLYYLALDSWGDRFAATTIAAPMLAEVIWNHSYDPINHCLQVDRQIYRLAITYGSNSSLLHLFDAVDELCLCLSKPSGNNFFEDSLLGNMGYKKLVEDMDELPRTKILEVKGLSTKQHLGPTMLHLFGKCGRITKLKIDLFPMNPNGTRCSCGCSCAPHITLNSLEEVEMTNFSEAKDDIEFLKLLFRCKMKPRRMAIYGTKDVPLSLEAQKTIWALSRPYCTVVEFDHTQFHR